MIPFIVDYASPSVLESRRDEAVLGLEASARRPVRFHGKVTRGTFLLRVALRALGEAIWSSDTWIPGGAVLDPVVTVHPDRLFFEAFSQDQSVYVKLAVDRSLFETEGDVRAGTTNVDFTAWLWAALAELRSSRETWLRVEASGLEVRTAGSGGRFEQKVDLPDEWVRGFLQLQGAMAMPGTLLRARPVDLLSALRYLRYSKARLSPRALRFEMEPGRDARIVLEPWEHVVPLKGCAHSYDETRVIRTWGRRRLKLIEGLLPFADGVTIFLKGRALPSFYAVRLPGMTFLLGLTGWSQLRWTETAGFDLLTGTAEPESALLERALKNLAGAYARSAKELAEDLGIDLAVATTLLVALCRKGRAFFDVERREFRHRELFEAPIDERKLYPPDPRRERIEAMLASGAVTVESCVPRETRKMRKLPSPDGPVTREVVLRDWIVTGSAGGQQAEVALADDGRILFGSCGCEFFRENLLNRGPCEHIAALARERLEA